MVLQSDETGKAKERPAFHRGERGGFESNSVKKRPREKGNFQGKGKRHWKI